MNPIGKTGLVTSFIKGRNGRKHSSRRVKPEYYFWLPYVFGGYKTKISPKVGAQTLKWEPPECFEMWATTCVVFLKIERECWEHWCLGILKFKSGAGFKFYLSVADAVFSASIPSEVVTGCTICDEKGYGENN